MKIIIITQDDPFYLGKSLLYLLENIPSHSEIVGCVLSQVSPFGKKETFFRKAIKTLKIFGVSFFLHYTLRFIVAKIYPKYKIKNILNHRGIPIISFSKSLNNDQSLTLLKKYKPDLLISIAGNEIFKKPLIELAPKGCLNLHTALLPKYRGLMPSFWVIKNQEKGTGVSVFFVDENIDSGPILVQKHIPLVGQSQEMLIKESKKLGMRAIVEAIDKIHLGDTKTIPNPDEDQSYFSFPTKEDVKHFKAIGAKFF